MFHKLGPRSLAQVALLAAEIEGQHFRLSTWLQGQVIDEENRRLSARVGRRNEAPVLELPDLSPHELEAARELCSSVSWRCLEIKSDEEWRERLTFEIGGLFFRLEECFKAAGRCDDIAN